jgi:hypothetical protein
MQESWSRHIQVFTPWYLHRQPKIAVIDMIAIATTMPTIKIKRTYFLSIEPYLRLNCDYLLTFDLEI